MIYSVKRQVSLNDNSSNSITSFLDDVIATVRDIDNRLTLDNIKELFQFFQTENYSIYSKILVDGKTRVHSSTFKTKSHI